MITITGGIAAYPIDGSTESEILRKADQALYRAKKTGRNISKNTTLVIPAHYVPAFKPAKVFAETVKDGNPIHA